MKRRRIIALGLMLAGPLALAYIYFIFGLLVVLVGGFCTVKLYYTAKLVLEPPHSTNNATYQMPTVRVGPDGYPVAPPNIVGYPNAAAFQVAYDSEGHVSADQSIEPDAVIKTVLDTPDLYVVDVIINGATMRYTAHAIDPEGTNDTIEWFQGTNSLKRAVLWRSTNLVAWEPLFTNWVAPGSANVYYDTNRPPDRAFYRVESP